MKKRKILISVALAAAAVFSLGSCSNSESTPTPTATPTETTTTPVVTTTPVATTTPQQGTSTTPQQGTSTTPQQGTSVTPTPTPTPTPTSVTPQYEVKTLKLHYNPLKYNDQTSEVDQQDVFVDTFELDQEDTDGTYYGEIALPTATNMKDDYRNFAGWFTDKECTIAFNDSDADKVTDDVELYAKWVDKGTIFVDFEAKADDFEVGTLSDKKNSIFTFNCPVRKKAASANGESFTNSFQIAATTSTIKFTPGAATTMDLYFTDQSGSTDSWLDIKQDGVALTEKGKTTDATKIGLDGTKGTDGGALKHVQVEIAGGKEVIITRGDGTIDLNCIRFTCELEISEMKEINIADAGLVDYIEGQTYDKSSIIASLVYKNNSSSPIDASLLEVDLTNVDKTQEGTYTATVSYEAPEWLYGYQYTQHFEKDIEINIYTLEGITVSQNAIVQKSIAGIGNYINETTPVIYAKNGEFSSKSINVKATASLNTKQKVFNLTSNDYTIDNATSFDAATLGAQTITVAYTTNNKTESQTYVVTVVDFAAADAIAVDTTTKTITADVDCNYTGVNGAIDSTKGNQFSTINAAMQFLRLAATGDYEGYNINLHISAGYYNEKVEFDLPNMTVTGDGAQKFAANSETYTNDYDFTSADCAGKTIIEWDSLYGFADESGFGHTTDSTATVAVRKSAENFTITDITISNYWNSKVHFDAANYHLEHRALALIVYADKFSMDDCALYGYQDTIELFKGRQLISNTLITGTTDFIFGYNNTTLFGGCEIRFIAAEDTSGKPNNQGGYMTAFKGSQGSEYVKYGAIFTNCDITSDIEVLYAAKEVKASTDKTVEEVFADLVTAGLYLVDSGTMTQITTESYDENETYYVKTSNCALARAWDSKAKVAIVGTQIGEHVSKAGFTSESATTGGTTRGQRYVAWGTTSNFPNTNPTYKDDEINYYEFNNSGDGALATEVAGMHFLTSAQYNDYISPYKVFSFNNGTMVYEDNWLPMGNKDVTVKYYVGTTLVETVEDYANFTTKVIKNPTAPEGKKFDGWYTEDTFANKYDFDTTPLTAGTLELYAKFVDATSAFEVYNVSGETATEWADATKVVDNAIFSVTTAGGKSTLKTAAGTVTVKDGSAYTFTKAMLPNGGSRTFTVGAKKDCKITIYYTICNGDWANGNQSKSGDLTVGGTAITQDAGNKASETAYSYTVDLAKDESVTFGASSNRLVVFGFVAEYAEDPNLIKTDLMVDYKGGAYSHYNAVAITEAIVADTTVNKITYNAVASNNNASNWIVGNAGASIVLKVKGACKLYVGYYSTSSVDSVAVTLGSAAVSVDHYEDFSTGATKERSAFAERDVAVYNITGEGTITLTFSGQAYIGFIGVDFE